MNNRHVLVRPGAGVRTVGVVIAMSIAIAVAAHVRAYLPFTPVPITLQVFAVIAAGLCLGSKLGAISAAGYLALGVCGAPVWAGGGAGLGYLLASKGPLVAPTLGYLAAFPAAAYIAGRMWETRSSDSYGRAWVASVSGVAVIYLCGFAWLAAQQIMLLGVSSGLTAAWVQGVAPFVLIDIAKALVAASLVATGHRGLRLAHVRS